MIKEPSKRLGSKNDSTEIKAHPWFADVDWTRVLKKEVLPTYFLKRVFREIARTAFQTQYKKHPRYQQFR